MFVDLILDWRYEVVGSRNVSWLPRLECDKVVLRSRRLHPCGHNSILVRPEGKVLVLTSILSARNGFIARGVEMVRPNGVGVEDGYSASALSCPGATFG
jgi:hypothetical protein